MAFITENLGLLPYQIAYEKQKAIHQSVVEGQTPRLLLLEHQPVITQGRKDQKNKEKNFTVSAEYLQKIGVDVVDIERGGSVTYHGPGQLVGYPIFPVGRRVRDFLRRIENALIKALDTFGIKARPNPDYAGVYVGAEKIASIGVAVSRGVAWHGFALNVSTDLQAFDLIVPCGICDVKMTSMEKILGQKIELALVKKAVKEAFEKEFQGWQQ